MPSPSFIILLGLSFIFGLATAYIAQFRGRSFSQWLVWGTLFAPVAMIVVLLKPNLAKKSDG